MAHYDGKSGISSEYPWENQNLFSTCGNFKRACELVGGVPLTMLQPALVTTMDALSGMIVMGSLKHLSVPLLFFMAMFLDSEILVQFICLDMLDKDTCVDILQQMVKIYGPKYHLTKVVISYFRTEFGFDPAYVTKLIHSNPRRLRWAVSNKGDMPRNLSRMAKYPTTWQYCNEVINKPDYLSTIARTAYTSCCMQVTHWPCVAEMMDKKWGSCKYCNSPYLCGLIQDDSELGVVSELAVIRTPNGPPAPGPSQGEIFKFAKVPLGYYRKSKPLRIESDDEDDMISCTSLGDEMVEEAATEDSGVEAATPRTNHGVSSSGASAC